MAYVCDYMKRIVVYNQDGISVTLTRCGECSDCYHAKVEMPVHSCTAIEELGKLLAHPRFAAAKVIIEGLRK